MLHLCLTDGREATSLKTALAGCLVRLGLADDETFTFWQSDDFDFEVPEAAYLRARQPAPINRSELLDLTSQDAWTAKYPEESSWWENCVVPRVQIPKSPPVWPLITEKTEEFLSFTDSLVLKRHIPANIMSYLPCLYYRCGHGRHRYVHPSIVRSLIHEATGRHMMECHLRDRRPVYVNDDNQLDVKLLIETLVEVMPAVFPDRRCAKGLANTDLRTLALWASRQPCVNEWLSYQACRLRLL